MSTKKSSRRMPQEEPAEFVDDDEEEEEEEEEDEEARMHLLATRKPPSTNNGVELAQRLDDIAVSLPWVERLDVTSSQPLALPNAEDDLRREEAIMEQAAEAVTIARKRLDAMEVPYVRPEDYYAEMIKSDKHMQKIRDNLLFEDRKMAAFEKRKKDQEQKKYGKQIMAEKIKEKGQIKRANLKAIDDFKERVAGRKSAGGSSSSSSSKSTYDSTEGQDDDPFAVVTTDADGSNSGGGGGRGGGGGSKGNKSSGAAGGKGGKGDGKGSGGKSAKRQAKDTKFGFGGGRKGSKRNTADSTHDMASGKRMKTGAKARPGKSRRSR